MSKSLGNGLSVPVVLAEHSAWVVRYALGSVQYRSMLEWSDQTLAEAEAAYERIMNFIGHAADALGEQPARDESTGVSADNLPVDFVAAMNDDVNVSRATAAIFPQIRDCLLYTSNRRGMCSTHASMRRSPSASANAAR